MVATNFNEIAAQFHKDNEKWWIDPKTGARLQRNKGEMMALMHSEISEMLEGVRKNKMDEHIPHRSSEEVELADLFIRALDYAGGWGLDLDGAIADKRAYNAVRADHKHENRVKEDGKKF